jgi:predicted esterase
MVLWGGGVPADLDEGQTRERLAGVEVVLVNGREDPHVSPAPVRADLERLQALGISARTIWFDGGHTLAATILHSLAG